MGVAGRDVGYLPHAEERKAGLDRECQLAEEVRWGTEEDYLADL